MADPGMELPDLARLLGGLRLRLAGEQSGHPRDRPALPGVDHRLMDAVFPTNSAMVASPLMASRATFASSRALSFFRLPATPSVLVLVGGKLGGVSGFCGPPHSAE